MKTNKKAGKQKTGKLINCNAVLSVDGYASSLHLEFCFLDSEFMPFILTPDF